MNGKSYAAICECGVVRGSIRVDRRNAREMGKAVTNWIRCGYTVKFVTDAFIRDHAGSCKCEKAEAS